MGDASTESRGPAAQVSLTFNHAREAAPDGRGRHFLLVSAPFGPFAREVGRGLSAHGARCTRTILNAGDALDWGRGDSVAYRGRRDGWSKWLSSLIAREGVTDLVTYGDSSAYAAGAIELARTLGLRIHVLEQG